MKTPPSPHPAATPGVMRALDFIERLAADPAWRARGELPGVRALARLSGISHFTLWKALRLAAAAGLVTVEPGRRPRLKDSGPPPAPPVPEAAPRKWERLRLEIERDLLQGIYRPGEAVPSLKELQAKYGVCYSTLRKALRELERAGRWPPAPAAGGSRGGGHYVLYICWGDENGNQHFDEPFDYEYLKALRAACERLNLDLAVAVYVYRGAVFSLVTPPGAPLDFPALCERAVGFLLRTACPRDVCADALPVLARHRKPVAVLDEIDSPSLPGFIRGNRLIKAFRPTISAASGEIMARHLLAMGHKRLAVITPFREAIWSRNRMAGLAAVVGTADPEAVAVGFGVAMPYQQRHMVRESRAVGILRRSLLRTPGWKPPLPSLRGLVAQLETELHLAARRQRLLEALAPQLEKALKRKDLTAWVAIDDDTALLLMDFLRGRGLRIPRDLSLVGFDDTAEGARRDLTSYNFGFDRFNHYVLRFLLEPARVDQAEARGARAPEGSVIARGSVRRRGPGTR